MQTFNLAEEFALEAQLEREENPEEFVLPEDDEDLGKDDDSKLEVEAD